MTDFIDGDLTDPFDPEAALAVETKVYEQKTENEELIAAHLRRSQQAYRAIFVKGNATAADVDFVMRDLAWFCKAYDPLWSADPRTQDRFVARREVFQRIMEYTSLDHSTLAQRYIETQS